jgi:xylulokinase
VAPEIVVVLAMGVASASTPGTVFLGFDLGTHALKACAMEVGAAGAFRQTHAVDVVYSRDLPMFSPPVHINTTTGTATSDPRLFLAALDAGFAQLQGAGCPMHRVAAISGSAQMHGSVFVGRAFATALSALRADRPLHAAESFPDDCFAFPDAPVWMDSSTTDECAKIEERLGGPLRVAEITGSRAYERFTGAQVLKRALACGDVFARTRRVLLLSSFLASVVCGELVPEDVGDASGTNMFAVASEPPAWCREAVLACGADGRLCDAPVEGWSIVGRACPYFTERYGLAAGALCCAFSGDNPNTIASYGGLKSGDLVVSLGTSDTAQWMSTSGKGALFGHTFRSPLSHKPEFFRMLCYANVGRATVPAGSSPRTMDVRTRFLTGLTGAPSCVL